jgi:hypothetical protein
MCLRPGGALVAKTFTFARPFSVSVLGVCSALFDSFRIAKPGTSRPTNSEVYLVGTGFRGLGAGLREALLGAVENFDFGTPLFPLGAPAAGAVVGGALAAARELHAGRQVACLEEAVGLYLAHKDDVRGLRWGLAAEAEAAQRRWLRANPVVRISDLRLVSDNDHPA